MKSIIAASINNVWFDVKATGRKVVNFLTNQCEVKDIIIIGVLLWLL